MDKKKINGEVFTPKNVIDYMLDTSYQPSSMSYILEPGCGDGRFIIKIIERLMFYCGDNIEMLNDKISKIYGIDIDENNYNTCIENIEKFLNPYEYVVTRPNIIHDDALLNPLIDEIKFDYIVGNPPYVRIHNLKKEYLLDIQKKYEFLKNGMVDIYYGFLELYRKCLSETGVVCYITPNSYLYNSSSEKILNTMYSDGIINKIFDFKSERMFENASTYTCITVLKKTTEKFSYSVIDKDFSTIKTIDINYGKNEFNFFTELQINSEGKRFSELFKVKTGFATLADKVFVINKFTENVENNTLTFEKNGLNFTIELSITKKCIKASKYDGSYHRVIFPYKKLNDRNVPLTEEEMEINFPLTLSYLATNRIKLDGRDNGKEDKDYNWFMWGRTQGVNNTEGKKVAISTMFEKNPFFFIDEDVLIYSGYYIIINEMESIFTDQEFLDSLTLLSKPIAGGWYSLQKKTLDNVIITNKELKK